MKFKEFFQSSVYAKLIAILGILLIALVIFSAGIAVGYERASFSMGWEENDYGNMSRFDRMFEPFTHNDDNINSHGAIGNITSIQLPTFLVRGPHQAEQVVMIGSSTILRLMRSSASIGDLKSGEQVIVIGAPDQEGRIQATFVRIINMPPAASSTFNNMPSAPQGVISQ